MNTNNDIFIVLLRGINVSGKNIIKMDLLRKALSDIGFEQIKTYIQSGNIVLKSKQLKTEIKKNIETVIQNNFNFSVPVLVISSAELNEIIANNNFIKNKYDSSLLHVSLMHHEPEPVLVNEFIKIPFEKSTVEYSIDKKNIYLYCPLGYSNSKLSNNLIENKLKVICTTRNWKTMITLHSMAQDVN